jgi:hypothetical protein
MEFHPRNDCHRRLNRTVIVTVNAITVTTEMMIVIIADPPFRPKRIPRPVKAGRGVFGRGVRPANPRVERKNGVQVIEWGDHANDLSNGSAPGRRSRGVCRGL